MRVDEASVCPPHNLVKLPEFGEEVRNFVVHFLDVIRESRLAVLFNVPDAVGQGTALGTGNLLLVEAPFWQFHFMGEQNTTGHNVHKLELRLDRPQPLLRLGSVRHGRDNFHAEEVIGVSLESFVAIGGDFLLPIGFSNRRTDIMRVKASVSSHVVELDGVAVHDVLCSDVIPGPWSGDLAIWSKRLSLVLENEDVVVVLVGVKCDLLLLASAWVHVAVRVEVTSLCIVVSDRYPGAKDNIDRSITHTL